MIESLSKAQKIIVETDGNLIVKASAGTGKTHTLVTKIDYDINKREDHKQIAAITFTIKAANEIKERLNGKINEAFVGTNNSFAIEEIIKNFLKDILGDSWDFEISTDYSIKFNNYDEGMKILFDKHMLGSYNNSKMNFIFQLAYNVLFESKACQLYLKSKYFKMYIDEYQDCDEDMNKFFMYICDVLKIELFIVGDDKQSIYIWRGAYPKAFKDIEFKNNFKCLKLYENYRSCKQIQNYSNLLNDDTCYLYEKLDDLSNVLLLYCNSSEWTSKFLNLYNSINDSDNSKTAILRRTKNGASYSASLLTKNGLDITYIPQTPIDDIANDSTWIYQAIARYIIIDDYSFYDFINSIPNASEENNVVSYVKKNLEEINIYKDNYDLFCKFVVKLMDYMGYDSKQEDLKKLFETINDEKYYPSFQSDKYKNTSMTIHSSKGLEFDNVVLFAEDYYFLNSEDVYVHYVASTRAKSKLIIIYQTDYLGCKNFDSIKYILEKSNLRFSDIAKIIK